MEMSRFACTPSAGTTERLIKKAGREVKVVDIPMILRE